MTCPTLLAAAAWTVLAALAPAAAAQSPTRGELLYTTHCIACHRTQMHWRDNRLAVDWPTLLAQVRRFEGVARLGWSDEDVQDVARHLNETIYRFPPPPERRG